MDNIIFQKQEIENKIKMNKDKIIINQQNQLEELQRTININKKKYKIIDQQKQLTELQIIMYTNKNRIRLLITQHQNELEQYSKLLKLNENPINNKLKEFELIVQKLYLLPKKKYTGTKETIPKALRTKVWTTYISEDSRKGKCFCCQIQEITESNFECGHVISERNGGLVILDNLRPVCSACNKSMSSKNMFEFIKNYGLWKQ